MVATCDVCKRNHDEGDLHELSGLDAHSRGLGEGVRICDRCLDRRQTRVWTQADPDHDDLVDALQRRTEPKRGRYSFLEEDEEVHLVRLRDDWVEQVRAG